MFETFFYTRNQSRNRNLEQNHGSGSDRGEMLRFWQFRFRLRNTGTNEIMNQIVKISSYAASHL